MRKEAEAGLELVWDGRALLGEGPVWDERTGELLWVDILNGRVHVYSWRAGTTRTVQLDRPIGAVVPRASGAGWVGAMRDGLYLIDPDTAALTRLASPESDKPDNRFNDGKCDDQGRFWAGTMSMRDEQGAGALYCLEPNGSVRKALEGVTVSNGLGWSPDGRTMYYIDSPTRQIAAFDYDPARGELSRRRIVVSLEGSDSQPDGMTVDAEGMLWVAEWDGWQVSRWNPLTGEKLGAVAVPAARVTSCAFGGPQGDELYITTATVGLGPEALERQPQAGGLFRIKPGVQGRPTHWYGG